MESAYINPMNNTHDMVPRKEYSAKSQGTEYGITNQLDKRNTG